MASEFNPSRDLRRVSNELREIADLLLDQGAGRRVADRIDQIAQSVAAIATRVEREAGR